MDKKQKLSALSVFISACLFSLGGICIKSIPWNALAINGARSIIAIVIMFAFLKATSRKLVINRYVMFGGFCLFATNTFYVLANKLTTAANAIIIQFTAPVFIIIYMWVFFKEKPGKTESITCAVTFFGIVLFFIDSLSAGDALGNFLALLSGMSYAVVFMLNTLPKADAFSSVIIGQALNAAVGLPFLSMESNFESKTIIWLLVLGVFQLGLSYVFFTCGLQHTPAVAASLISGIEPVLNPIIVAVFLHETISPVALLGAVVVLTSIIAYNIIKSKPKGRTN